MVQITPNTIIHLFFAGSDAEFFLGENFKIQKALSCCFILLKVIEVLYIAPVKCVSMYRPNKKLRRELEPLSLAGSTTASLLFQ